MVDERIKNEMNRIRSEMLVVIVYAMVFSLLIKIMFFEAEFKDVLTEYIVLIFAPIYQFFRAKKLNVNIGEFFPSGKKAFKKYFLSYLVAAITYFIIFALMGNHEISDVVLSTITFMLCFIIVRMGVIKLYKIQAKKAEKEFDDEE